MQRSVPSPPKHPHTTNNNTDKHKTKPPHWNTTITKNGLCQIRPKPSYTVSQYLVSFLLQQQWSPPHIHSLSLSHTHTQTVQTHHIKSYTEQTTHNSYLLLQKLEAILVEDVGKLVVKLVVIVPGTPCDRTVWLHLIQHVQVLLHCLHNNPTPLLHLVLNHRFLFLRQTWLFHFTVIVKQIFLFTAKHSFFI